MTFARARRINGWAHWAADRLFLSSSSPILSCISDLLQSAGILNSLNSLSSTELHPIVYTSGIRRPVVGSGRAEAIVRLGLSVFKYSEHAQFSHFGGGNPLFTSPTPTPRNSVAWVGRVECARTPSLRSVVDLLYILFFDATSYNFCDKSSTNRSDGI